VREGLSFALGRKKKSRRLWFHSRSAATRSAAQRMCERPFSIAIVLSAVLYGSTPCCAALLELHAHVYVRVIVHNCRTQFGT